MKRSYHHGDLATALVDASVAHVRAEGIGSLSLRGIAQSIGVSPAAAYHHFRDKEALMAAVCKVGQDSLAERFRAAVREISGDTDRDAVRRFEAIGDAYIQFAIDEPRLFSLAFHPVAMLVQAAGEGSAMDILMACLSDLDRRGLLRPSVAPGAALLAWAAVHGFAELLIAGLIDASQRPVLLDAVLASAIQQR